MNYQCPIKAHGMANGHKKDSYLCGHAGNAMCQKSIGISRSTTDGMTVGLLALQPRECRLMRLENLRGSQKVSAVMIG